MKIKTTKEHFEKYSNLYNEKGDWIKNLIPATKKEIELALISGDTHLNSIKLNK